MPPRLRLKPKRVFLQSQSATQYVCWQCRHASLATAVATPPDAPPPLQNTMQRAAPIARYPSTQPPSYKRPEYRKSQLHRQYQSILRSTPLIVLFQHNNLKANEWMGIRRELTIALDAVDKELAKAGEEPALGPDIAVQTIQTGIFASALKVVENWTAPDVSQRDPSSPPQTGLSRSAWMAGRRGSIPTGLEPLLSGPLAILTLPTVSPAHLKAALSILAPNKAIPAPRRRVAPGLFEPAVQTGLQKLMLLGARVEGRVMDMDGTRWVGGIEGGMGGLRARLVAMLQGAGAGVTSALDAATRSLYFTVEGRRIMLEEEEKKDGAA